MSYITTYTGRHFDPINPDPELILIEDIAHALSLLCRGNGHVTTFWSVGEHCICCAKEALKRELSDKVVLACLLHDASESYMSDVPRPLKQEMKDYQYQEDKLLNIVYKKFLGELPTLEEEKQIKEIDDDLLWYDLEILLREKQNTKKPKLSIQLNYEVRPFETVEKEYLSIFTEIKSRLDDKK